MPEPRISSQPDCLQTRQPAAFAEEAEDVHLGRRLGEREERRPEADPAVRTEQLAGEQRERALEIAHRDAAVDRQTLDLVEHRRVRDVGVPAVHAARADDPHRRLLPLHGPDLHRRGVRPQEHLAAHVEGVLHVAGGVVLRDVEGLEVVVVELDLGPLGDREAHAREHVDDLVVHLREGMEGARDDAAGREASGRADPPPGGRAARDPPGGPAAPRAPTRAPPSPRWPRLPTMGRSAGGRPGRARRSWVRVPRLPRYLTRTSSRSRRVVARSISSRAPSTIVWTRWSAMPELVGSFYRMEVGARTPGHVR